DVPTPRVLLFAPNGDLFVTSPKYVTSGGAPPGAGAIFMFRDERGLQAPTRYTFAKDDTLVSVHGIAIKDDRLYYTLIDAVYSVPYAAGDTQISIESPQRVAD